MPQGLQIWDEAGRLTLDTNLRVGRILGSVGAGPGTGSIADDRLLQGEPFAFFEMEGNGFLFGDYDVSPVASLPRITFSGNTMTFTRNGPPPFGTAFGCTIYYGVR